MNEDIAPADEAERLERRFGFLRPGVLRDYHRRLSGLDALNRLLEQGEQALPIGACLGFRAVSVTTGRAIFEGEAELHQCNPFGMLHGGLAAAMLDSALGCAVNTTLAPGHGYGTVDLAVKYLRPIPPDGRLLRAEGQVVHAGRTMATADATLKGVDDDKLYATGTTTCLIYPLTERGEI
ncbi:MAG: PaaI family thioesterase [Geminicoccaceae bacterium]